MNEFQLIDRFFKPLQFGALQPAVSIGDDCAVMDIPSGYQLALTMDTLVENIHFFSTDLPFDIAYKALAVNLSDLAAMSAKPIFITLSLTMPLLDPVWLSAFADGLKPLMQTYQLNLIGGDICKGPLSITIQAHGLLPKNKAVLRSGARVSDDLYVSGTLGDAGLAFYLKQNDYHLGEIQDQLLKRLHHPTPRVELGLALQNIASCMIDLSDGLAADLGHILNQSQAGAHVLYDSLPKSKNFIKTLEKISMPLELQIEHLLNFGDDYELCFSAPQKFRQAITDLQTQLNTRITQIGSIQAHQEFKLLDSQNQSIPFQVKGHQHF